MLNFHTYSKSFEVPAGIAELIIRYATDEFQTSVLDIDIIDVADITSGYEDDDQLTFYPNVLTIKAVDFSRNNYDVLKYATQLRTPIMPFMFEMDSSTFELEKYYGVDLKLNNKLLFRGYIDKKSLEYDDRSAEMSFDALDYSALLKQMNIKTQGVSTEPHWWYNPLGAVWWLGRYRNIYPELPDPRNVSINTAPVTNNADEFIEWDKGYYFKHNWRFNCDGNNGVPSYERRWNISSDPKGWHQVQLYMGHIYQRSGTCAEFIKNVAREIGCTIGTDMYNKVYCFKRFLNAQEMSDAERLDDPENTKIIDWNKYAHLGYIRGVKNVNQIYPANITIEGDYPAMFDSSKYFEDDQLDISTIVMRNLSDNGENGPPSFKAWDNDGENEQSVLNGIWDNSLGVQYHRIERIITKWTYLTRIRNKDRFEMKLRGINYWMHKIYLFWYSDIHYAYLRPMVVKRSIVNNITEFSGLEINL